MRPWYQQEGDDVLTALETTHNGLSKEEVTHRLLRDGANELPRQKPPSLFRIILVQLFSPFSLLLIVAGIITLLLKEEVDAVVILAAVFLNLVLSSYFEKRTYTLTEKLRSLGSRLVKVRRAGEILTVDSHKLVVGDCILIEAGQRVPADCRLLESNVLRVDESVLTGEPVPRSKNTAAIPHAVELFDQKNMIFSGTLVTHGKGEGIVVATGLRTVVGGIERLTEEAATPESPLVRQIAVFNRWLTTGALIAAVVYLGIILISGKSFLEALQGAAALGVSAVPEGLPVLVTLGLVLGVHTMAEQKALVKNMSVIDTMAYLSTLITDKTGTITQNKLTVKSIFLPREAGLEDAQVAEINPFSSGLSALLLTSVLANEAAQEPGGAALHDPLEAALLETATALNVDTGRVIKMHRPLVVIPFSSERKYMAIGYRHNTKQVIWHIKGAPDVLIAACSHIYLTSHKREWSSREKQAALHAIEQAGSRGEKILACAVRETGLEIYEKILKAPEHADVLLRKELTFLGAFGLEDPLRSDAKETIEELQNLGIAVKISTGDHATTARAIAHSVGLPTESIFTRTDSTITVKDAERHSIFARVQPADKVALVSALQKKGAVVAMTGDGINDVPALKQADIGITVGKSATDAAHDIADIILLDSSLRTILSAIRYGRSLMQNMRLIILFLISTSILEAGVILLSTIVTGGTTALVPTQILWINLLTDTLLAIPLLYEQHRSEGIVKRKRDKLFGKEQLRVTLYSNGALFITAMLVFLYFFIHYPAQAALSQTLTFYVISLGEVGIILSLRQPRLTIGAYWNTNPAMLGVAFGVILLQIVTQLIPQLREALHLTFLTVPQVFLMIIASSSGFILGELYKMTAKREKA